MLYLSPQASNDIPENFGQIFTPQSGVISPVREWAADNGAFTGKYEYQSFYAWLEKMKSYQDSCLFIAVPDIVCDAGRTFIRYFLHAPRLYGMGYKLGFILQDGQEDLKVIPPCHVVFVGGSTDWKLSRSVDDLILLYKRLGKWVHVGRVNSQKRIKHFQLVGVDSVDGTTIAFEPSVKYKRLSKQLKQSPLFNIRKVTNDL